MLPILTTRDEKGGQPVTCLPLIRQLAVVLAVVLTPGVAFSGHNPIPEPIPLGPSPIKLKTVATGLSAPNWGISAPGLPARLLFVTDQNGTLWEIDVQTGRKRVFLDVSNRLVELGPFDERGLLGMAFHPDYAWNGRLYTYTSEPVGAAADFTTMGPGEIPDHQSLITEWLVPNPGDLASVVDPTSDRELLRIDQPQANHNGGGLNFGPDAMLYISLGDGGNANDEGIGHGLRGNGQDPRNVLGSILRIDPIGANSDNGQYGIPPDNPFLGISAIVDEIFAFGFRNPFRFSFDTGTGLLIVADVGQNEIEEIDLVTSGADYGWNFKEGTFCFNPDGTVAECQPGQVPPFLTDPIAQYDHDEGSAIIGGFVYRGTQIPALQGRYVFGDYTQNFITDGRLFFLNGGQIVEFPLDGQAELGLFLLGFAQDGAGEIYVLANSSFFPGADTGVVLKISSPDLPAVVHSHIQNFNLENLNIQTGTTVEWHNHDVAIHTSTSGGPPNPDGIWDSGLLSADQTFSQTFNEAGTFPYFCTVHPFMTGTVTVNP